MQLSRYHEYGNKLEKYLMLETFPLGVKLLRDQNDIPLNFKQPKKDFCFHLSLC